MTRQLVRLDGLVLDRFHAQARALRPVYTRTLEVVYTLGKETRDWVGVASKRDSVRGIAVEATVRDLTRHLYGRVLIDVAACVRTRSPSLVLGGGAPSEPAMHEVRREVFKTFLHESFHVVQAWWLGGMVRLHERVVDHGLRHPDRGPDGVYHSNPWEQAAFDVEQRIPRATLRALDDGGFDELFALPVLERALADSAPSPSRR
jgi:hypothetical protein